MPADAITEATNEVANLSIADADEEPTVNENTDDSRDSTAEAEHGAANGETGDPTANLLRAPERTPYRTADQHASADAPATPEASPEEVNTTDQTPSTEPTADSKNKSGDTSVTVVGADDERERECIICLEEILEHEEAARCPAKVYSVAMFHGDCIANWFDSCCERGVYTHCPVCRAKW